MPEINEVSKSLEALLLSRGIATPAADFQRLVVRAVDNIQKVRPINPREGLSSEEVKELEEGGFELEPVLKGDDPLATTAAEFAAMVTLSLTVPKVAAQLGVNPSRVRQRLNDNSLYGFKLNGKWRVPIFQFDDGGMVPKIGEVLKVIEREVHAVAIQRWFMVPNPDLLIDDENVSPLTWLRFGAEVEVVVELAADL